MSWLQAWRSSSAPRAEARRRALLGLALAAALLALLIVAQAAVPVQPELQSVRGVLLDVRASSILQADSITLRDTEGRVWTFQVDPEVVTNREEPQSASHLRQHMALAEPMLVRYRETDQGLRAIRIIDAE